MSRPATGAAITVTAAGTFKTSVHLGHGRRMARSFATEHSAIQWRQAAVTAIAHGLPIPSADTYRSPARLEDAPASPSPATATPIDACFERWWKDHFQNSGRYSARRANDVRARWRNTIRPFLEHHQITSGEQMTYDLARELLMPLTGRTDPSNTPGATQRTDGTAASGWDDATSPMVTISQAVAQFQVGRSTLRRWRDAGLLPGSRQVGSDQHWLLPVLHIRRELELRRGAATWPPRRPLGQGTVNDAWFILRTVLQFGRDALQWWTLSFEPTIVEVPKSVVPEKEKPRLLSYEEVARIASFLHPIHQIPLWLGRLAGLRISESFGVLLQQIVWLGVVPCLAVTRMGGTSFADFDRHGEIIHVPEVERLKTRNSRRMIPMPRHLARLIFDVIEIYFPHVVDIQHSRERLIPRLRGGGGQAAYRRALAIAAEKAGIDPRTIMDIIEGGPNPLVSAPIVTSHMMRKAFSTDLRLFAVDDFTRRQLIGKAASPDANQGAYQLDDPQMKAALDAVAKIQADLQEVLPNGLAIPTARGFQTPPAVSDGQGAVERLHRRGWLRCHQDEDGYPLLFSTDIAVIARVSLTTARRWLRKGAIPSVEIVDGGRRRQAATRADVEAFLLNRHTQGRTLVQVADDLGERPSAVRQRIRAQGLAAINIGRVLIVPPETERILRVQYERFDELERDWVPRADAAEVAGVPEAMVRTWLHFGWLTAEAGRGNRHYVDPDQLAVLASKATSATNYRTH